MIECDFQLHILIRIMLSFQPEFAQNGIAAIEKVYRSRFTGSIFPYKCRGIEHK